MRCRVDITLMDGRLWHVYTDVRSLPAVGGEISVPDGRRFMTVTITAIHSQAVEWPKCIGLVRWMVASAIGRTSWEKVDLIEAREKISPDPRRSV